MTCDSLLLELTGLEGCANRLRTVFRCRRTYGYLGRGAVMNAVVISTMRNAAAYSLDMLGDLVKRYLIHIFRSFRVFLLILFLVREKKYL